MYRNGPSILFRTEWYPQYLINTPYFSGHPFVPLNRPRSPFPTPRVLPPTSVPILDWPCQSYIDPDSICCVVLDEAHHCGKEHPFNRVARSFLTTGRGSQSSSPPSKGASEYPKVRYGRFCLFTSLTALSRLVHGACMSA